jgi:predicted alpha/beta superfamily hydrolase
LEDLGPYTIPNSHTHDFVAKSNGRRYRVSVATPGKKIPGQPRPVLYATDANMGFGQMAEVTRMLAFSGEIPPVIVVGLGYPDITTAEGMVLRNYELTHSVDAAYLERSATQGFPVAPEGLAGAAGFLEFIRDEVAPQIDDVYGGDPNDRALYGYSLGGLYTLWTLLQERSGFQRFVAGSPSLWWGGRDLFRLEAKRAEEPKQLNARVFVSAGELEETPGGPVPAFARMVSNAVEFASTIAARGYEGLEVEFQMIPRVGHQAPPMVVQGLTSVYRGHPGIVRPPA